MRRSDTPQTAFDTFMARWKKPDKEIEILMPVMGGNPGDMNACVLKVNMKPDSVYLYRNGAIAEMPIAEYKDWMIKHEYDPEHGKDHPTNLPAGLPRRRAAAIIHFDCTARQTPCRAEV